MKIQHSRWPGLLGAFAAFAMVFAISAADIRAANPAATNAAIELRSPDGRIAPSP